MNYRPHPPWRVEEERKLVAAETCYQLNSYNQPNYFRESFYFILDGNNNIVAMIADVRDAELIVDLANQFFSLAQSSDPE